MSQLPAALKQEISSNLTNLQRDLDSINKPELMVEDFAEGYQTVCFHDFLSQSDVDHMDWELLTSFYRSIEVLQSGHPNLLSADQNDLEHAYRTLIESAIGFGETLVGSRD